MRVGPVALQVQFSSRQPSFTLGELLLYTALKTAICSFYSIAATTVQIKKIQIEHPPSPFRNFLIQRTIENTALPAVFVTSTIFTFWEAFYLRGAAFSWTNLGFDFISYLGSMGMSLSWDYR